MKLKTMLIATLLLCSTANAAYYLPLGNGDKITLSNDSSIAVIVTKDSYLRFKISNSNKDNIDNDGRPFALAILIRETCESLDKCDYPPLIIKIYKDKKGGVDVSSFDVSKNKNVLIANIPDSDITRD